MTLRHQRAGASTEAPARSRHTDPSRTGRPSRRRRLGVTALAVALVVVGCTPPSTIVTNGQVVTVIDGDTLDLATDGPTVRVRVLGIDTPELGRNGQPAECQADQARERAADLVAGRAVTLVGDPSQPEHDRYGRRLAYVEHAGRDLGLQLLQLGLAETYYPRGQVPPTRAATYAKAEDEARRARAGLWSCPTPHRGNPSSAPGRELRSLSGKLGADTPTRG